MKLLVIRPILLVPALEPYITDEKLQKEPGLGKYVAPRHVHKGFIFDCGDGNDFTKFTAEQKKLLGELFHAAAVCQPDSETYFEGKTLKNSDVCKIEIQREETRLARRKAIDDQSKLATNSDVLAQLQDVFRDLGLSLQDLQTNSLEQNFRKIMEHMQDTAASAKTIAEMREVFGRGGSQLIPVAKEFNQRELEGRGLAMRDDTADTLTKGKQTENLVGQWVKMMGAETTAAILRVLTEGPAFSSPVPKEKDFLQSLMDKAAKPAFTQAVTAALSPNQPTMTDADKKTMLEGLGVVNKTISPLLTPAAMQWSEPAPASHAVHLRGREDPLLRVGNFLGSNSGAINAIGQETNKILHQILGAIRQQHSDSRHKDGLSAQRSTP